MPVTVLVRSGAAPKGEPPRESLSITFDSPMVVIGRGEGSEVRLPDPSVSHRHATIRQRGSEYILVDEGSANGTFMGGVKLGAHAPRILRHGDLARVGRVWLEIRFDGAAPTAQTVLATKELALALVARALDAEGERGGPRVNVTEGPDKGKSLSLDRPGRTYVIGRGQEVDLVVEDVDASRRHVQIVRRADQALVRDLGSKNGAELGGQNLEKRDRPWRVGETLRIGKNTFSYEHPAIEALAELERAADEKLRPDEPIPPPELAPSSGPPTDRVPRSAKAKAPPADAAVIDVGAAPIAEVPQRREAGRRGKAGWSSTDFVVVLLAVGVLALSVVGLFWLLKG
jgi:pSer/pThr/pTyr-binding forkhead associated (FHA) protein